MRTSLLSPLRPKPFRGDVVAAGVVVLTTLVWVVAARFSDAWGPGAHLAYAAGGVGVRDGDGRAVADGGRRAAGVPVGAVRGVASRCSSTSSRSSAACSAPTRRRLGRHGDLGAGRRRRVRAGVRDAAQQRRLHAAGRRWPAGGAVLAAVEWIWSPDGFATDRWVLLALMVVYGFAAIGQRDRRPRHGVALIDAAGLAVAGDRRHLRCSAASSARAATTRPHRRRRLGLGAADRRRRLRPHRLQLGRPPAGPGLPRRPEPHRLRGHHLTRGRRRRRDPPRLAARPGWRSRLPAGRRPASDDARATTTRHRRPRAATAAAALSGAGGEFPTLVA